MWGRGLSGSYERRDGQTDMDGPVTCSSLALERQEKVMMQDAMKEKYYFPTALFTRRRCAKLSSTSAT
jgi:hypothetical protein